MRWRIAITLAVAVLASASIVAAVAAKAGPLPGAVQAIRGPLARYHDFNKARADGYSIADEPCVASPAGTMGIHAVDRALTTDLVNDPLRPEILLYVPRGDHLELVGVEYMRVALANTSSGPAPWFEPTPPPLGFFNPAPTIFGHTFDGPMPGHNPEMPWHYDIHVWVFAENPSGLFAPFNPAISC